MIISSGGYNTYTVEAGTTYFIFGHVIGAIFAKMQSLLLLLLLLLLARPVPAVEQMRFFMAQRRIAIVAVTESTTANLAGKMMICRCDIVCYNQHIVS